MLTHLHRDKAATALKGVVNVGAVDGTVSQKLASKYQVQGFPTIKIFGADKRSPTDYQVSRPCIPSKAPCLSLIMSAVIGSASCDTELRCVCKDHPT